MLLAIGPNKVFLIPDSHSSGTSHYSVGWTAMPPQWPQAKAGSGRQAEGQVRLDAETPAGQGALVRAIAANKAIGTNHAAKW